MPRLLLVATAAAVIAAATRCQQPDAPAPPDPATTAAPLPPPAFAFLQSPPMGLPPMPLPPGPAPTPAMFELGRALFADPILSRDRTVSCASCHPEATGYASPAPLPAGVGGRHARRHAPSLLNRGWGSRMRWDGSTPSLDDFVLQPIADHDEMDLPLADALARLRHDPAMRTQFAAAFADGVSQANLRTVLATFVRGIVAGDAPVDRFHAGDAAALRREQRAGLWLFESKAGCWRCHSAPLFTDEELHNTGVSVRDGRPDPGPSAPAGTDGDAGQLGIGRFKTPTLRGIARTAPYMHDGSLATLEEVVQFYVRGGNPNPGLDAEIRPLQLDADEQRLLLAFLRSL